MDTEGGPWIVIQRRTSGDVGFNRNWADYKNGFGDLSGNFWLGNEKIWLLTLNPRVLRVELESWDGTNGYAQYTTFQVASEAENYRLNVQGKSGNITDSLSYHNGYGFTTSDRDHDSQEYNCAVVYEGAWWHHDCLNSNLNGPYKTYTGQTDVRSMLWNYFPSNDIGIPLKTSRMMVREA
ncbi:ficolin-3-like [Argopecten irradians]|uniref:ficolin-3-like n=1 Tax=Argopecten irradians TaxID=31199 RepID=UPI0037239A24